MTNTCGCCEGLDKLTPLSIINRPGLDALVYRVGTHASFLESMLACLSSSEFPELSLLSTRAKDDPSIALLDAWATVADVLTFYQERIANEGYLRTATERRSILELARLIGYRLRPGVSAGVYLGFSMDKDTKGDIPAGTRAQSVPGPGELPQSFETSEALPAREEWNGLKPRLSRPQNITRSNVNTINDIYFAGTTTNLKVNDLLLFVFGNRPNQQFVRYVSGVETQIDKKGRWKRTRVSLQPATATASVVSAKAAEILNTVEKYQAIDSFGVSKSTAMARRVIGFTEKIQRSVTTEMSDRELLKVLHEVLPELREEHAIAAEGHYDRLKPWVGGLVSELSSIESELKKTVKQPENVTFSSLSARRRYGYYPANDTVLSTLVTNKLIEPLSKVPSIQPTNERRLSRSIQQTYDRKSDIAPRLLASLKPQLKPILYSAIKATSVWETNILKVYAMRTSAQLFGHNAPKEPDYEPTYVKVDEKLVRNERGGLPTDQATWDEWAFASDEANNRLFLDNAYEEILPGTNSYIVIKKLSSAQTFGGIQLSTRSRSEYGLSGKTTKITLANGNTWWDVVEEDFATIRGTKVFAESELLTLAEAPIVVNQTNQTLAPIAGKEIELAQLYDGLEAGRWAIVSGERYDAPGVHASELLMVAAIEQRFDPNLPGDYSHTVLKLAEAMNYQYKRDSVTIYGNVVKATHGETRKQVLGSGDGSKCFQQFTLSYAPLTHVAANTPSGVESTLQVRINDILWEEAVSLFGLGSNDRNYITSTDSEDKTSVRFGDGNRGLRLPSGLENVTAAYRSGIGSGGNVTAEQISLLATRPLGVKAVINPLPATGGSDRDTRDQARRNAPYAIMALDRLVSVQDYADFARTFAGVGKASATRLSEGHRQLVYVTIAGADDIPISQTSDLYRSLRAAFYKYGDPHQPVELAVRELILLIIQAKVRSKTDYQWETVEPNVRSALLDHFSFERRDLGQDAWLSEAITIIKSVAGVEYVDVDVFDGLVETKSTEDLIQSIERLADPKNPDSLLSAKQPKTLVTAEMARLPEAQYFYTRRSLLQKAEELNLEQRKVVIMLAQLAVLKPDIKDTLILTELT